MITKVKIAKYTAVFVVITAGVSFSLWGHAHSNLGSTPGSYDKTQTVAKTAKPSAPVPAPSKSPSSQSSVQAASAQVKKAASAQELQAIAKTSDLNNYVLQVIATFNGGRYPYLLNDDYAHYNGVTENIFYQGQIMAKANPDGSKSSHCVGLTYEVFFKAMQERNREAGISPDNFNNMSVSNMKDFMLTWFNALGTPKLQGDQLAGAIVKYGLGTRITNLQEAKTGDFIDFSRVKSGHAAVFINWLRDGSGKIVGFKYWSTQESTNGIAYKQEYFSDNSQSAFKGSVDRNQLYIGRIGAILSYRHF